MRERLHVQPRRRDDLRRRQPPGQIGGGEDKGARPLYVDAGVRMGRADERHVERVRHRHVVEKDALAGEQACVLAAADRLAEGAGDSHGGRG
jgi:hypothetical protein